MLEFIYRFLLTLNSTFLVLIIYLLKLNNSEYNQIIEWIKNRFSDKIIFISQNILILILLILIVIFTKILLKSFRFLESDDLKNIEEIEQANNSFLPTYLGYFFVALSISSVKVLFWIYLLIYIFTFLSSNLYFNPLFLIWGYNFYNITTKNKVKIFLITKRNIRKLEQISFENLKRINNFTFIELEVYDE